MSNRTAILALAAAGVLWGLTVPLSKVALEWLGPGWLTVARFAAAAPVLALVARHGLRDAFVPRVVAAGALGFGAVTVLQNAGIERTSVSHAALVVGAAPVLVALIAAGLGRSATRPITWGGYAVALLGIALVAGAGGGGATAAGDLLVLASVAVSATFIVIQPKLLAGRDPAAVTAVQFAAAAVFATPIAVAARRRAGGARGGDPGARRGGARRRRDAAAVLALRLRAGPGPGRAGRRVREPRAGRRRGRGLARSGRDRRGRPADGRGHRRCRDRAQHAAAA